MQDSGRDADHLAAACVLLLGVPGARTLAPSVAVCRSGRMSMCDAAESADSNPAGETGVAAAELIRTGVNLTEADARVQCKYR